jgi:hypothetical protein
MQAITPRQWLRKERQCPRLGWLCGRRSDGGGARAAVMQPSGGGSLLFLCLVIFGNIRHQLSMVYI